MKRKIVIAACVILGAGGIATASAAIWYQYNFRAHAFEPVRLSGAEEQALQAKAERIQGHGAADVAVDDGKTVVLSEREINGWLQQQDLGDHLKVEIARGQVSAVALLPMPGEVPVVGGHTVRLKMSLQTRPGASGHLGLFVSDIRIGGVSPPNAWVGGIKGRDLFDGAQSDPVAKAISEGIRSWEIVPGAIRLRLNE